MDDMSVSVGDHERGVTMTTECHLAGMLDRDQRTAKTIFPRERKDFEEENGEISRSSCRCCREPGEAKSSARRTSPSPSRIREKERRNFWVTLSRLHRTVILCFYLSLFAFPTTLSAPVRMEKWMIPCGHSGSSKNSNQIDLIQTIIDQSRRSLVMIETLKDKFAIKAFGSNWTDVQEFQGGISPLSWFPKIEKELGKPLSQDELDKIELNALLKDSYKYLQIIAVAVDQMISDEEKRRGPLVEDYRKKIELYVLSVLCEIQTASNTLNVARHKDVERTIIDAKDKNGDATTMMTRHYLIIRDYLRLLEYIIESYEHVKSKL